MKKDDKYKDYKPEILIYDEEIDCGEFLDRNKQQETKADLLKKHLKKTENTKKYR